MVVVSDAAAAVWWPDSCNARPIARCASGKLASSSQGTFGMHLRLIGSAQVGQRFGQRRVMGRMRFENAQRSLKTTHCMVESAGFTGESIPAKRALSSAAA